MQVPLGDTVPPPPGAGSSSRHARQIALMLQKKDILDVLPDTLRFYSNVFLASLITIKSGDFPFKISLEDAYFHLPTHPDSQKYLNFPFMNMVYPFWVLSFSLSTTLHVLTHLGHTVAGYLHHQGISVLPCMIG